MEITSHETSSHDDVKLNSNCEQDQHFFGKILKTSQFTEVDESKLTFLSSLTLINDEYPLSNSKTMQICAKISQFKNLRSLALENEGYIDTQELTLLGTAISQLVNLQTLTFNLYEYTIKNYGASMVSIFLDNLVNLSSLTLSLRSHTKQENILLPLSSSLAHCQQLKYLFIDLEYSFFTAKEAEHLRNGIAALVNLTNLSLLLNGNIIDVSHVKILTSSVKNCLKLETLTFKFNRMLTRISEENQRSQGFELVNLPKLRQFKLFFRQSSLSYDDIKDFSEAIAKQEKLLNLSINLTMSKIEENAVQYIESSISNLLSLSSLDINFQNSTILSTSMLPLLIAIQNLTQLTSLKLNLYWDEIKSPNYQNLSSCISQLTNLQTLSLSISREFLSQKIMKDSSDNQLSIKQLRNNKLEFIFSAISTLERLQCLDLRILNYQFEGNIWIAARLQKIPQLQDFCLIFQSCQFAFDDIINISLGISKLVNLHSLQVESFYLMSATQNWYDLVFNGIIKLRNLKVLTFEYDISQQTLNKIYANNSRLVTVRNLYDWIS